jgi:outer membrane lipoprotein-sorting protein
MEEASMMKRPSILVFIASLLFASVVCAAEPTLQELLDRTDDLMRGRSSAGKVTMRVKTARWERSLTMQVWSKGKEKTLVRILAPAKEKGVSTLKVGENVWNYLPNVDRTIKVPASMMSGSWMGSHFTNDDLVKEARFADEFDCKIESRPDGNPKKRYLVGCTPKPNAPVVWGRVRLTTREDLLPLDAVYYDERGAVARTLTYSDIKELGGRQIPGKITLVPGDKPGELTELVYEELAFDLELPESTFSLQALKR